MGSSLHVTTGFAGHDKRSMHITPFVFLSTGLSKHAANSSNRMIEAALESTEQSTVALFS